jgi:hypothetical protein
MIRFDLSSKKQFNPVSDANQTSLFKPSISKKKNFSTLKIVLSLCWIWLDIVSKVPLSTQPLDETCHFDFLNKHREIHINIWILFVKYWIKNRKTLIEKWCGYFYAFIFLCDSLLSCSQNKIILMIKAIRFSNCMEKASCWILRRRV